MFRAVLLIVAVLFSNAALADKRIALVVGNSAYSNIAPLANPKNDALLIARTLSDLGFTLVGGGAQLDLDKTRFETIVQQFGRAIVGSDVAMFYYAGHGVQVRGSNFLVPVNANPTREADVDFQMIDVALVMRQIESSGTKLNFIILDACRNNPFAGRGLRSAAGGLAQVQAPEGTLISFATQPGSVAQDGDGANSPYSKALADTMRRPGLSVFEAFNQVGLTVKRSTGGSQQPWVSSSPLDGNFQFASASGNNNIAVIPPLDPCSAAQAHWAGASAIGTVAAFEDHVRLFPNCTFSGLARAAIAEKTRLASVNTATGTAKAGSSGDLNQLLIDSTKGRIVVKLRPDLAPQHVERIRQLARDGFYNNVPFHRVIDGFMAQTGDGSKFNGTGGSKYPNLEPEFSGVAFKRGIVAMARAASPSSANSQFFIMYAETPSLNGQYTVIGEVASGMDVVDRLKKAAPGASGGSVPDPDKMLKVQIAADVK